MLKLLEGRIRAQVQAGFAPEAETPITLVTPPDENMGDLSFSCFSLAKILKKAPNIVAQELAEAVNSSAGWGAFVREAKVVGPYVNFFLRWDELAARMSSEILFGSYGLSRQYAGERVMVEFSAPNTNKPQHLGHIRNNCLGQAIVNLLRTQGCEVIAANLINDRGIHICKSMAAYKLWGQGQTPAGTGEKGDHFVGRFYVLFEQRFREEMAAVAKARGVEVNDMDSEKYFHESAIGKMAQEMLVAWESGDREVRALWQQMNDWVYAGFAETYRRLGCRFDKVYYESLTYLLGKSTVEEGLGKSIFYRDEAGAVWCDLTDEGFKKKLLLRADGTSVYLTQDLGTARLRADEFGLDRSLYVVASEQQYHFKVLIAILKKMGFAWAERLEHVVYGMVYLPEGRMKSREGKVVDADKLMNLMAGIARKRLSDDPHGRKVDWSDAERDEVAEMVGVAAVKFFILSVGNRIQDIHFDPSQSISFEGKTGPYLLYTHVRMSALLDKAGSVLSDPDFSLLRDPRETVLFRALLFYPAVVEKAARQRNPAELCDYLYKLAAAFNAFYTQLPILNAEPGELATARLALTRMAQVVLHDGLAILGIPIPARM